MIKQCFAAAKAACRAALTCGVVGMALVSNAQAQTAPTLNNVFAFTGSQTLAGVVVGANGQLYGTSYVASSAIGGLIFRANLDGSKPVTVYQFGLQDGLQPQADLLVASDGYMYGTTHIARASGNNVNAGTGTVFRVLPDGTGFHTIHTFDVGTSNNSAGDPINTNGAYPDVALIEGFDGGVSDGYVYGATTAGGPNGTGAVYRMKHDGTDFQVLYSFSAIDGDSKNADGASPAGALVQGSDGALYGTATRGGPNATGVVFRIERSGVGGLTVLHTFSAVSSSVNTDGANPRGALVQASDGKFYGVTNSGGANGNGVVYSISNGSDFAVVYSFASASGAAPLAGLTIGPDGRLYGTASTGGSIGTGSANGNGVAFAVSTAGAYEVLHTFDNSKDEGASPQSRLVLASDGNYYGTTSSGGKCSVGNVFRLNMSGGASDGYSDCIKSNGGGPMGPGLLLVLSVLGLARWRSRAVHS